MTFRSFSFLLYFIIIFIFVFVVDAQYDFAIKDFTIMVPNDDRFLNMDKLKIKRINRTHPHFLMGEFEFFDDVGNDYEIEGVLYKMQGYEYRATPYKFRYRVCDLINSDKVFFPDYVKTTTLPTETCPVPRGKYRVNGYSPNVENLPPVLDSGEYLVKMTFYKDGTAVQGVKLMITAINKYPAHQLLNGK